MKRIRAIKNKNESLKRKRKTTFQQRLKVARMEKTGYYWNGIPCHCDIVNVRVTEMNGAPMYWATPFIGTERQAIRVSVPGREQFYIDNHDGTGWIKVVHGLGASSIFHRGITAPEFVSDVAEQDVQQFDIVKYNTVENEIQEWMKTAHPAMYEKSKALRDKARIAVEKKSNAIIPKDVE